MEQKITYEDSEVVYLTTEYEQFIFFGDENRDINEAHVKDLTISVKKTNGNVQAIIVIWYKGKLYVIEGQHRLLACKAAGVPVKFEVVDKIKNMEIREFIIELNINNKNWNPETYFRTKAKNNGQVYQYWLNLLDVEKNWSLVLVFMRLSVKEIKADVAPGMYPYVEEQIRALHEMNEVHRKITKKYNQSATSMRLRDAAQAMILLQTINNERRDKGERIPKKIDYDKMIRSFKQVVPHEGLVDNPYVMARIFAKALDNGRSADNKLNLMGREKL